MYNAQSDSSAARYHLAALIQRLFDKQACVVVVADACNVDIEVLNGKHQFTVVAHKARFALGSSEMLWPDRELTAVDTNRSELRFASSIGPRTVITVFKITGNSSRALWREVEKLAKEVIAK